MTKRHKVFVSYYHADDQIYKNRLVEMNYYNFEKGKREFIFEDYSVRDGDIDDSLSAEQIRRIIRDEYIRDATVLILLCGNNTKYRKHVDWEIHAAMFDTELNPKMGIIVINLPSIRQGIYANSEEEKKIISDSSSWLKLNTRSEFERYYPYLPSRIIDSLSNGADITIVDWERIVYNSERLMLLIDNAYARRKNIKYDHSAPLKRRNS